MLKIAALLCALALTACVSPDIRTPSAAGTSAYTPQPYVQLSHPDWARNAVLYQVNLRQFTAEGTLAAAQAELPRLKALGVDILWLMPVQPIGKVNRKGSLGSPYSIADYYGVNPELGTTEDMKAFVDAAHDQGFHVILDWVANHSAWDNPLVEAHPEWYDRDWKGDLHPTPWTDWADIIDFDYSEPGLRAYMTDALRYWVTEIGVDGFRCDVAGYVPLDFWETVRRELDTVKPVFMLAEWQERDLHQRAFDASYGWAWKEAAHRIAAGEADASAMTGFLQNHIASWPHDGYRMLYTENHDQNAWDGSTSQIYGPAYHAFLTLSFVSEGIPLVHNGQEVGNQDQLAFFERDPIVWDTANTIDGELIRRLIAIRKANPALWNGEAGGRTEPVTTSAPSQIVSFVRQKESNRVVVLANLSPQPAEFSLRDGPVAGSYYEALSERVWELALDPASTLTLPAWRVLVLTTNDPE